MSILARTSTIRDSIFGIAQQKFYDEGYFACSVKSIATELAIPSSLILYHFRQKKFLVEEVYIQFEANNREAIAEVAGEIENTMLSFFVTRMLLYREALLDSNIERLRYEMLSSENLGFARIDMYKVFLKQLSAYYHLNTDHLDPDVLAGMLFNATKSVFIDLHEGTLPYKDENALFSTVEAAAPRYMGISEIEIQRWLSQARELTDKILKNNHDSPREIFFRNLN